MSSQVIDKGISRLAYQFIDSEKFIEFLTSFLDQFQYLEDENDNLATLRYLDTAEGVQLDGIGEIVGKERPEGMSDGLYLLLIRAKIIQNKTVMVVDETTELISFMLSGVEVRYFLPTNLRPEYHIGRLLTVDEQALINGLPLLIGLGFVEYRMYNGATTFSFAEDPEGLGFGTLADANIGGNFASII
ncbi:DUF2612 domain-containing protein [Candidatus Pacearchaeota archaeon]|nr:DUF2612 domain-containing protein [Candidatus Pacearchaeota archaeon]